MENGIIVYYLDMHTKNEVKHQMNGFTEIIEIGDYISYPLYMMCIHRMINYVSEMPEEVAKLWLKKAQLEPKNKLLQVVYIGGDKTAAGIYQHDSKYYLYSLICNS